MRTIFALALILVAADARAERANNDEVVFGGGGRVLRTASANVLTDDNLASVTLAYARSLGLSLPGVALWAEGGAMLGGTEGTMFTSMSTQIGYGAFTAGLAARHPIRRWLVASARVAAGIQRVELELDGGPATLADAGWGGVTVLGAAIDVLPVARAPFGFGVRAEASYVLAQAVALAPERELRDDDVMRLPLEARSLGSLDLSGPAFTISAIVQF